MGFSGYAAQGAQQNLEELFAAQLAEELDREQQRALQEEREAQRAFRERDLGQRQAEQEWRVKTDERDFNRLERATAREIEKEENANLARRNMSELTKPGLEQSLADFAMASGVDVPSYVQKQMDPDLREVQTVDPTTGKGETRMVSGKSAEFKEGLPIYEKTPVFAPQQWGYEKVIRGTLPDGTPNIVKIRENEQLQPGDIPYEGGRGGGTGSRAEQDAAESRGKLATALDDIEGMAKGINTVRGGIPAFVIGSVRDMAATFGGDEDVRLYNSQVGAALPLLARAIGHVGVLTEQDVQSVRKALPTAADSRQQAQNKMGFIRKRAGAVSDKDLSREARVALIDPTTGEVEVVPWEQRQAYLDAGARVATREQLAASGKR